MCWGDNGAIRVISAIDPVGAFDVPSDVGDSGTIRASGILETISHI